MDGRVFLAWMRQTCLLHRMWVGHVIEKRRRSRFLEAGHRLRDHLAWRSTEFEIPFLDEPGSHRPDGVLLDLVTG